MTLFPVVKEVVFNLSYHGTSKTLEAHVVISKYNGEAAFQLASPICGLCHPGIPMHKQLLGHLAIRAAWVTWSSAITNNHKATPRVTLLDLKRTFGKRWPNFELAFESCCYQELKCEASTVPTLMGKNQEIFVCCWKNLLHTDVANGETNGLGLWFGEICQNICLLHFVKKLFVFWGILRLRIRS